MSETPNFVISERTRLLLQGKLPIYLPRVLPLVVGVVANVLFWGGALIPFHPAEAEFFVYLNAAIILLATLLAVAGAVMVLTMGLRHLTSTAFSAMTANAIVVTAGGLLLWGVVLNGV